MLRRWAEENIGFTGVNIFLHTFNEKIIFTAIKNQSILHRRVMAVICSSGSILARQDEMHLKRQKLHYEEITPCLKDVTRVWEEMLLTPSREEVKFDSQKLLSCVKEGTLQ